MALIFRQTITTNSTEVYMLYETINQFLFKPLRSDRKVIAEEFLSIDPLRKLATRLYTKYQREAQSHKARQFSFTFSPQEVLAITICIRNYKQSQILDVILGKVQQRSLNLESYVELS
jgi:hypothetical protein